MQWWTFVLVVLLASTAVLFLNVVLAVSWVLRKFKKTPLRTYRVHEEPDYEDIHPDAAAFHYDAGDR